MMRLIPDYADLMTLRDFVEQVKLGAFVDYDGSGYYAFSTEMSDEPANPSDIFAGRINRNYTHVAWFNK